MSTAATPPMTLCALLEPHLVAISRLLPLIAYDQLDADARDRLIVQIHAAQRDLEVAVRELALGLPKDLHHETAPAKTRFVLNRFIQKN